MKEVFDDILKSFIEMGLRMEAKHKVPFELKDAVEKLSKCENCDEIKNLYDLRLKSDSFDDQMKLYEVDDFGSGDTDNIKLQVLNAVISTHRKNLEKIA